MYDEVIDLLKAHEYFRGVSDVILGEIARFGTITNYDSAAVVHQLNDPLRSICFVLRGRLKTVRVDSRGDEHLFQMFERGDQYGMMLGGLGEPIPLRIFALEPSTILMLDHEKSMELTLLYPELRRQWLQSYARNLRRRFLEPAAGQAPKVIAMLHQSPTTRNLAQKIIGRLQGLGEAVSVLSDADSWRALPGLGFRSVLDGDRLIEVAEIRRQIAEWNQAKRIVVDITAAQNLDWAVLLRPADCALVFIRPNEIAAAIERLRALELASRGWRDKIAIVWVLEEGSGVVPVISELQNFASRQFKICESPLPHPWGMVHSTGMERLIHYLRGIKIGVALGPKRGVSLGLFNIYYSDWNGKGNPPVLNPPADSGDLLTTHLSVDLPMLFSGKQAKHSLFLNVHGNNLLDESYYSGMAVVGPAGTGVALGLPGPPRTVGLSLNLRY